MNGQPHTHNLNIYANGNEWIMEYGDQKRRVRMPRFRDPEKVLKKAIAEVIATHDAESRRADAESRRAEEKFNRRMAEQEAMCSLISRATTDAQAVLESVSSVCEKCSGRGYALIQMRGPDGTDQAHTIRCTTCNATGKVAGGWPGTQLSLRAEHYE